MTKCKHKFSSHVWRGAMDGSVFTRPQLLAICEKCGDHKISGEIVEGQFQKKGVRK